MNELHRYLKDIENGIAPPAYIPSGGEDSCDVCGGDVKWVTTGEPCQGYCIDHCADKIHEAWRKRTETQSTVAEGK